jgi:hypothetical protein
MKRMALPPIEELRQFFQYDQVTGVITWRVDRIGSCGAVVAKGGTTAGWIDTRGYRQITFFNRNYPAHRIAWKLFYGTEPPPIIDHVDRNRT